MTAHELKAALTELSALRSDADPIVSLYLDVRWTDAKQRERARLYVEEGVDRLLARHSAHPNHAVLERSLRRVARLATERAGQSQPADGRTQGLAVFCCEAFGLWRVVEVARPFTDQLGAGARPHLLQLARLADDIEPAIVVFVHGRGAQFYEVALGQIAAETTVEGVVQDRHGQGARGGAAPSPEAASGGTQHERKSQRHVHELVERVRRDAMEQLVTLWERDPRSHVVVVGTGEAAADFERGLPERVRAKILARLPRPPGKAGSSSGGKDALVAQVVEMIVERERVSEGEQVEHAIGEAMRGGMAVLGPEDVVLAVNERRVHRLILEVDFERSGWRCRNCEALGTTHDELCTFCQGPLARVDALAEELVGRVLADDGEVEVVAHTERLHAYDGVAALLRQHRPTGLGGRA